MAPRRTTPEHVPASHATEELMRWLESAKAAGIDPPSAFLHTALRLVYEHARLVIAWLVLENRRLPVVALFSDHLPTPEK